MTAESQSQCKWDESCCTLPSDFKAGLWFPLKKASAKIMFHMEGKHSSIFAKTWGWSCRKGEWSGHKIHPTWDLGLYIFFFKLSEIISAFYICTFRFFSLCVCTLVGAYVHLYVHVCELCVHLCVQCSEARGGMLWEFFQPTDFGVPALWVWSEALHMDW